LLLTLSACTAHPPADLGEAPPEIQLEGVGFKFFRGNELRAVGKAVRATFMRDTGDGTAQNVRMRILPSPERGEIDVSATQVAGSVRTEQADARGGVRIADANGAVGLTDSAHLDGPAHKATGEEPVSIVGPGYRMHARSGFWLDMSEPGALSLKGPIDTTITGGVR
jgi:lipopolysaccharide export system protein LptC